MMAYGWDSLSNDKITTGAMRLLPFISRRYLAVIAVALALIMSVPDGTDLPVWDGTFHRDFIALRALGLFPHVGYRPDRARYRRRSDHGRDNRLDARYLSSRTYRPRHEYQRDGCCHVPGKCSRAVKTPWA